MANDELVLKYTGTFASDNLKYSSRKYYTKRSNTLATHSKGPKLLGVYLHGNSSVTVWFGAKDVSKQYAVRRIMRAWTSNLSVGPPVSRTSPYVIDNTSFQVDSTNKPTGEWRDAPGFAYLSRYASNERVLFEWVVWAETSYRQTVQELKGLYFIMVIDQTPANYKLAMSQATELTVQQTLAAIGFSGDPSFLPVTTPWKTEDDIPSGGWADRQTTWQDYALYNAQLPLSPP